MDSLWVLSPLPVLLCFCRRLSLQYNALEVLGRGGTGNPVGVEFHQRVEISHSLHRISFPYWCKTAVNPCGQAMYLAN